MMGKKIAILSVLGALLCAAQTASGIYSGSTNYDFTNNGRHLSGRIEFAVFDTQVDTFGYTPPGDGQYIYAYQIYNDQGAAQEAVGYFALLLGGAPFDGIGSDAHVNDTEAVKPSSEYLVDFTGDIVFEFISLSEEGSLLDDTLEPGMHSCILMFTSDNDWVPGGYQISGGGLGDYDPEFPIDVPEPATIFILGTGSSIALVFKRKFS